MLASPAGYEGQQEAKPGMMMVRVASETSAGARHTIDNILGLARGKEEAGERAATPGNAESAGEGGCGGGVKLKDRISPNKFWDWSMLYRKRCDVSQWEYTAKLNYILKFLLCTINITSNR